nr:hypothetical protein [Tanacetum cinerariifolium]
MGYEKPSTKLTFYKAFFSQQWKFLIHTILQCMSAKRTSWNEFSSFMALAVICLSTSRKFNFSKTQVGDISSHTKQNSSHALTQKVFANMRRVRKGFSEVDTPLFEVDANDEIEVSAVDLKLLLPGLFSMLAQVGDLSSHTTKYSSPALTQKVFANMRRVRKGFSRVETPLFEGMIVAQQADEGAAGVDVNVVPAAIAEPSIPSPTPTTQQPPPSQ